MLAVLSPQEAAVPDTVTLSQDRAWLSAHWPDGTLTRLAASDLRAACRCASCQRARADGTLTPTANITIVAVQSHGPNVGRLTFSDGHDRGLYPWSYLRALANGESAEAQS